MELDNACDGRKRGTCCRMWLINMEKMEKKTNAQESPQRDSDKNEKRTKIVKEANKPQHFPPPKKKQLNKIIKIKKIKAFRCI